MRVIGLTGGIGSGKSTVSRLLAELGATVLDADKVAHQLYEPGKEAWEALVAEFGQGILTPTGAIDRAKLGGMVFSEPEALKRLNRIMHPRIFHRLRDILREYLQQGLGVVVVEAAVLLEAGWTPLVDEVWVTVASEETVVARLQQKGLSPEQARARLRSQLPVEDKLKAAQVVIPNDGDLEELRRRVEALWQSLNSRWRDSGTASPSGKSAPLS